MMVWTDSNLVAEVVAATKYLWNKVVTMGEERIATDDTAILGKLEASNKLVEGFEVDGMSRSSR